MSDFFVVTGISPHDRRHFHNVSRATLSPSGVVGTGRCVGQTLERTPELLRRSRADGLTLFVNRSVTVGDCDGEGSEAAPGSLQFRDLTRPSRTRFETIDATIVMAPRHLVPEPLLRPHIHGLCLSPDRADVQLVSVQMAGLVAQAEHLSETLLATSIQALLMVAARMVELPRPGTAEPHASVIQSAVRVAAGRFIEQRLEAREAGLDMSAMLKAVGVSRATLYRAFNGDGGVRRYHQNRQLHHARAALGRRTGSTPSIAQIADDYGFASPSHFSRLFRQRYGHSPSNVIATGTAGGRGNALSMRHDLMNDWMAQIRRT